MKYREWIESIDSKGLICEMYRNKVINATSKKQLVDYAMDANGALFILEMQKKGCTLPYETLTNEFSSYINGKYNADYNGKYTSSMFCCYNGDSFIELNTTQTILLGCKVDVYVKEYTASKIVVDKNCEITIHCPRTSKLNVQYANGAKIVVFDNKDRVQLTEN